MEMRAVIVSSIAGLREQVAKRWTPRLQQACTLLQPLDQASLLHEIPTAQIILGDPGLLTDTVLGGASALEWVQSTWAGRRAV